MKSKLGSSDEETVKCYEELRSKGLAGQKFSQNLGLALFLHRGMAAWIKVWMDYTSSDKVPEKKEMSKDMAIPANTQSSMVMVLVNMILSPAREVLL